MDKTRIVLITAVLLVVSWVVADVPDLVQRVDPVFPGVKYESNKPSFSERGIYCSAGFSILYSKTGGQLGFMIASHCTDPGDWKSRVDQPYFAWWSPSSNYAGYTVDRGTNDAYYETEKSKPDAALWWVANRWVDNRIPTYLCGWSMQWTTPLSVVEETKIEGTDVWKVGYVTGCTGSRSAVATKDLRFAGSVYSVPYDQLKAYYGDSGGIVFRSYYCGSAGCGTYILGTIVGVIPSGGPWVYTLFQSADYSLRYYGVYANTVVVYPGP